MKLLAIDTSNQVMSIAIIEEGRVLGELTTHIKSNHSTRLMPGIEQLMRETNSQPKELGKIVVAKGPGSYTGLRIGVVTAKTLASTLNLPLVGVSSLQSLAGNIRRFEGLVIPIFDARRGNIYTGAYAYSKEAFQSILPDQHIAMDDWITQINAESKPIFIVSPDLAIIKEVFEEKLKVSYTFGNIVENTPSAAVLGMLGMEMDPENTHQFMPDYLKLAEAEENWRKAHPTSKEDNFIEKI